MKWLMQWPWTLGLVLVTSLWAGPAKAVLPDAQYMEMFDETGEPAEELLETLLYPGEFAKRIFTYVSEGDEALFCLDSSLGAQKPFAQVYPERIEWPLVGGVQLEVDKLDLKLLPEDSSVDDAALDEGFAIRWYLRAIGQDFSKTPRFKLQAVGAEVFSTQDGRVLMRWEKPATPPLCRPQDDGSGRQCRVQGVSREVRDVAVSPDGTLIALGIAGLKPGMVLYEFHGEPREKWRVFFGPNTGGAMDVSFSADGRFVACLLANGRIHRFDAQSGGSHLAIMSHGTAVASVPPGQVAAVAGKGGGVVLWRLADGTVEWRVRQREYRGTVRRIAVSGDGHRFATIEFAGMSNSGKRTIRVWEIRQRRSLLQLNIDDDQFVDLAMNMNGSRIYLTHLKNGLHEIDVAAKSAPRPVEGDFSRCDGFLRYMRGSNMLMCAVPDGALVFPADLSKVTALQIARVSHERVLDSAPGGGVTVAVGAGELLIWSRL